MALRIRTSGKSTRRFWENFLVAQDVKISECYKPLQNNNNNMKWQIQSFMEGVRTRQNAERIKFLDGWHNLDKFDEL